MALNYENNEAIGIEHYSAMNWNGISPLGWIHNVEEYNKWCRNNVQGLWYQNLDSRGKIYYFTDIKDKLLFDLTWK